MMSPYGPTRPFLHNIPVGRPSGDGANIVCLEIKQSASRYLTKLPHDLPIGNRRGMRLTCYKPQSLRWAD